ncbi:MAG: hypothetical protein U0136_14955 [Bdellovibrionota bacterium]
MSVQNSSKPRGVFLNQPRAQCSIFESGMMVYHALLNSGAYDLAYFELDPSTAHAIPNADFYVFNYHHATMAWIDTKSLRHLPGIKITVVLEMSPGNPFVYVSPDDFDAYIVLDPTMSIPNSKVYAFPRPLDPPIAVPAYREREVPLIGTFGFSTPGKGFELVVDAVNREFDRAIVRINIPAGTFADDHAFKMHRRPYAEYLAELCSRVAKPGIEVQVTNSFMSKEALIHWCAENTLNCFLYSRNQPGLSATTDQCITAGRPLAVSFNDTFRHIHQYLAPYPYQSLKESIATSSEAVRQMREDWTPANFAKRFEELLSDFSLLAKPNEASRWALAKPVEKKTVLVVSPDPGVSGRAQLGLNLQRTINHSPKWQAIRSKVLKSADLATPRPSLILLNVDPSEVSHEEIQRAEELGSRVVAIARSDDEYAAYAKVCNQVRLNDPLGTSAKPVFGRIVPLNCNEDPMPPIPVIAGYALSAPFRGIGELITRVQNDFEQATILLYLPIDPAHPSSADIVRNALERMQLLCTKPGIRIETVHDIYSQEQLLALMGYASLNAFLGQQLNDPAERILIDYALSVSRPLAISSTGPFRYLNSGTPSISIEDSSLSEILANGIAPLVPFLNDYSEARFLAELDAFTRAESESPQPEPKRETEIRVPAQPARVEYGIAVFHNIGDVLCATPIAKQLKIDEPNCRVTYFTSTPGEAVLRENPYIDEIVTLPGDPLQLDREIEGLKALRPWKRFFTPAAYMNYEAIPGGSIYQPKGTVFGIVKAAAGLHWTIPFIFPFRLTEEEQHQARAFWNTLPAGPKILVETDYRSEQSPWTDDYNFQMLDAFRDLDPVFVFTSKVRPRFFESFVSLYPRAYWADVPFRLNAELFNLCDAYVGVSSGISCLTYSDYCRTDVPRIEVTRGEHWGAAELPHHKELFLCYSRERFATALENVKQRLAGGGEPEPSFAPARSAPKPGCCPVCNSTASASYRGPDILICQTCTAVFHPRNFTSLGAGVSLHLELLADRLYTYRGESFFREPLLPGSFETAYIASGLGSVWNLRDLFAKLEYVLKAGGEIKIAAPNVEGIGSVALREKWEGLSEDTNRFHFSPKFLRELLIQSGFWIEEWSTSCPESSKQHILDVLAEARPDLSRDVLPMFLEEVNRRGAGEVIHIVARKRGIYKGTVSEAIEHHSSGLPLSGPYV